MARTPANPAVASLVACCWPTAALDRAGIAAAASAAQDHRAPGFTIETCQRIERYSLAPCHCDASVQFRGAEALGHLAEVAAGLHSIVLGEDQVLAQVREPLPAVTGQLRSLADIAIAAARQLRRDVRFNSHSGHLLDRALRTAQVEPAGTLLVAGTGQMARLIGLRALELGFETVTFTGRRRPDAPWFTREPRMTFVPLARARDLPPVAAIAGCIGSDAGELALDSLPPAGLIIDLGTPRNFAVAAVPTISIEQLMTDEKGRRHATRRRRDLQGQLEAILQRRLTKFEAGTSPVKRLREQVEAIRAREAERIAHLHPEIPRATIERITGSLVNQLFHAPTERLQKLDDAHLGDELAALFAPKPGMS